MQLVVQQDTTVNPQKSNWSLIGFSVVTRNLRPTYTVSIGIFRVGKILQYAPMTIFLCNEKNNIFLHNDIGMTWYDRMPARSLAVLVEIAALVAENMIWRWRWIGALAAVLCVGEITLYSLLLPLARLSAYVWHLGCCYVTLYMQTS